MVSPDMSSLGDGAVLQIRRQLVPAKGHMVNCYAAVSLACPELRNRARML